MKKLFSTLTLTVCLGAFISCTNDEQEVNMVKPTNANSEIEVINDGTGRDDGKEAGEFCPILYKKERVELLYQKTISFWIQTEGRSLLQEFRRIISVLPVRDGAIQSTTGNI